MTTTPYHAAAGHNSKKSSEPTDLERIEYNSKAASQLRAIGTDGADLLADRLDGCRPKARCLNAACQVCAGAAQQRFIKRAGRMWASDVALVHITIVPSEARRSLGDLNTLELPWVCEHLAELLDKAGFSHLRALAFVDLNQSVDLRHKREFWQPHFHMVATAEDTQDLTAAFRTVLRPLSFSLQY